MKTVSFYHKDTGFLNGAHLTASDEEAVILNTPVDHIAIEGHHDSMSKKVDITTGEIVEHKPPAPSDDHEWHDESKRWKLKVDVQDKIDKRVVTMMKIARLETKQPRAIREMLLSGNVQKERLLDIENQIIELRKDL